MREDAFGRDASKLHIEDIAIVGAGNITINFRNKCRCWRLDSTINEGKSVQRGGKPDRTLAGTTSLDDHCTN